MKTGTWKLNLGPDRYGRERVRTVNLTLDIGNFKDRPGFALLVLAANPDLSFREIQEVLAHVGEQHARSRGWISRRRWLFHDEGKPGAKPNADGLDEMAYRIMDQNPRQSNHQMAARLRQSGIPRSRDWVRRNRVRPA